MLQQEINLYRHFRPTPSSGSFLSWRRFWIYNACIFVLLILIYIFTIVEVYYMKSRDVSLQASLAEYQRKFKAIKSTFPELFFNDDIDESVKSLKKEVAAQEKIIFILAEREPFSADLIALSKSIVKNVWLTGITIRANGNEIALVGNSYDMTYIHTFIKRLGENQIYSQYDIDITNIKKSSKKGNEDEDNNVGKTEQNAKVTFEIGMEKLTKGTIQKNKGNNG